MNPRPLLSRRQRLYLDNWLEQEEITLNAIIWWCLPMTAGTHFAAQIGLFPSLSAFYDKVDAMNLRKFSAPMRTRYIIPVLEYAYQHGYFQEVLQVNTMLRKINRERFCYEPRS